MKDSKVWELLLKLGARLLLLAVAVYILFAIVMMFKLEVGIHSDAGNGLYIGSKVVTGKNQQLAQLAASIKVFDSHYAALTQKLSEQKNEKIDEVINENRASLIGTLKSMNPQKGNNPPAKPAKGKETVNAETGQKNK